MIGLSRKQNMRKHGKIAKMISEYGSYFEAEATKYEFKVFNMDEDFDKKLAEIENYLGK